MGTHLNVRSCADPEWGGQRVWTTPEKSQNIRFLSNTDPDPLNNYKATKPGFNVGPPAKRHLNHDRHWRGIFRKHNFKNPLL